MLTICTPVGYSFHPWYVLALTRTMASEVRPNWLMRSGPYIEENRNWLTAEALKNPECDGVLWVDADMWWEPAEVWRVRSLSQEREDAVVGAFYPSRGNELTCVGAPLEASDAGAGLDRTIVRAHHLGGGFLYTPRKVLEELGPPWWVTGQFRGEFRGEDVGFSMRCHAAGIPLYGCFHLRVGHAFEPGPRTMADWFKGVR